MPLLHALTIAYPLHHRAPRSHASCRQERRAAEDARKMSSAMRALPLRSADSASADAPRRAVQGADALVCKEGEMTRCAHPQACEVFFRWFRCVRYAAHWPVRVLWFVAGIHAPYADSSTQCKLQRQEAQVADRGPRPPPGGRDATTTLVRVDGPPGGRAPANRPARRGPGRRIREDPERRSPGAGGPRAVPARSGGRRPDGPGLRSVRWRWVVARGFRQCVNQA
jgi:hypothetical protein